MRFLLALISLVILFCTSLAFHHADPPPPARIFKQLRPAVDGEPTELASQPVTMPSDEESTETLLLIDSDATEVATNSDSPEAGIRSFGKPANLPTPSSMSVEQFEKMLFDFLHERKYQELGWAVDKTIRDTGPYINGRSYGTHPAVRVYYSPEVMQWLLNDRQGAIVDGAIIIKEQYHEPAKQHLEKTEAELRASIKSWTVMVKDSHGSHDGWFWSNPYASDASEDRRPQITDNHQYPFPHPDSGFGHYCLRCHAATQTPGVDPSSRNNEFTFSSLRNIEGFPGEPIIYRVDDSWREQLKAEAIAAADIDTETEERLLKAAEESDLQPVSVEQSQSHPKCTGTDFPEQCELRFNQSFATTFDQIPQLDPSAIESLPPVTHDWVIKAAEGQQDLLTSNQCMGCHAGLVGPYGPSMFVGLDRKDPQYRDDGVHISPYGEWRWSPMGLAGRNPVFFAQLESEIHMLEKEFSPEMAKDASQMLVDTCLRCHGAMGKHQFDLDRSSPDEKFTLGHVHAVAEEGQHIGHGDAKYGALARDGISCMICHRAVPREQPDDDDRSYLQYFLETSITGKFILGPPDELYGPFKDDEISPYVMEHGIGVKPKYNKYIQSSQMCGTCHTVSLPQVDHPIGDKKLTPDQQSLIDGEDVQLFKKFHHHIEQATYLEWLNSEYENEFNEDNPQAQSCQDCHMSTDLVHDRHEINLQSIDTRIAIVQDNSYPDAENLTKLDNLEVRIREEGYRRHNFVGLNVFLVELFRQFDRELGVRKNDFMTGSSLDIDHAIDNFERQARNDVLDLELETSLAGDTLTAIVDIHNKVGHRFPSGVGFRRAFVELLVTEKQDDGNQKIVWGSGRSDENGILIDEAGNRLPTEFFEEEAENGEQLYQKHHEVITSQDQVQIYETLLKNYSQEFTTSFIRGCFTIKDNRLLPRGWKSEGPHPDLNGYYLKATHPGKIAKQDSRYNDGSGSDEIVYRVQLSDNVRRDRLTVKASVYYQAIPPYFLKNLFDTSPEGKATQRLHYMVSHANLEGTLIENWKLLIDSVESTVSQ